LSSDNQEMGIMSANRDFLPEVFGILRSFNQDWGWKPEPPKIPSLGYCG